MMRTSLMLLYLPIAVCILCCPAFTAGPPASVAVTVTPSVIAADGNSFAELTAVVKDSSGNNVDDGTTVNWSATLGFVLPTSSTTTSGVAKGSIRASSLPDSSTITASSGSVNGTASIVFRGAPTRLVFDTSIWDYYLVADGTSKAVCRVKVTDSAGYPVADGTQVSFTIGDGNVKSPAGTKDGYATTIITSSSTGGTVDLTADCGSTTATIEVGYGSPVFQPSCKAFPQSIAADGSSTSVLMGTAFGEPDGSLLPDGASVSFSTDAGTLLFSANLVTGGFAETFLRSESSPTTANVMVSYGGQSQTIPVSFAGLPATISLSPSRLSIPAGDGHGTAIKAVAKDADGNPVADGTVIEFTTTSGTIDPKCVIEDGSGSVNLFAPSSAGTAVVTASSGSATGSTSVYFVGSTSAITVTPSLGGILADGASTCRLRILAQDSLGHPVVDGTHISLTTTDGSVSPIAATSSGWADALLTASSTAGTATVTATSNGSSNTANVVLAGSPSAISINAHPAVLPADGSAQVQVVANVTDSGSRPVADGTTVTFSTTAGTISTPATTTDGKAIAILTAPSNSSTATVTAMCDILSANTSVAFQ